KDRLGELKAEVLNKQAAASSYKAQRNLLTAQGVSLVESQIAEVQTSLLRTRSEYAQKQAEYSQLNDVSKRGETVASVGGRASTRPSGQAARPLRRCRPEGCRPVEALWPRLPRPAAGEGRAGGHRCAGAGRDGPHRQQVEDRARLAGRPDGYAGAGAGIPS